MKRNDLKKRISTILVYALILALFPNVFTHQIAAAAGVLPDGTLPVGWKAADVSASSSLGTTSYGFSNGKFALSATGGKIQSADDNVLYTYYPVSAGDFSITAKVTSTAINTSNNRALLMVKKDPINNGATSPGYNFGYNSSANTLISYRRLSTTGSSSFTVPDSSSPIYMKLERSAADFKTYYSKDGINFGNGTTTNPVRTDSDAAGLLSGSVYVGLAVAAASAEFTDVKIYQNGLIYDSNAGVQAPGVPTNLTASSGAGGVTLQWTATSGASSYNIYRSTASGSGYSKIATSTTNSYTDSNAAGNMQYFYAVSALAGSIESGMSAEAPATTPLSAPTGLYAAAEDNKVALTWTVVSGATHYNVKRGTDGLSFVNIQTNITATSFTDNGLTNGIMYYYAVTAMNEAGESTNSNVVNATPTAVTSTPEEGVIYVAPGGLDSNPGTIGSPTTFESAITKVAPGEIIYLRGGTYSYSAQITIDRNNSGTSTAKKQIFAFGSEKPVLDFSSQTYDAANVGSNARGLQINGNYWYVKGLEVKGSADNGIYVAGNYNRIENSEVHHNRDTGLQIGRYASTAPQSEWPSYNEIVNVYSHDNFDPDNGEDADGFAAKLTVGPGNVFDGCISAYNVDDGWDLYSKTETGPISPVTIRNSIAHHNGQTSDGSSTTNSDGNGFKLGGEQIAVNHIVINSIAYQNKKHGFTYNSNPGSITIANNTSYNNGQSNFAFDIGTPIFTNNLSYKGSSSDKTSGTDVQSTNVWWKNNKSTNANGLLADDTDFVSLSPALSRNADGSPNLGNFLVLAASSDLKAAGTPSGTDIGALIGSSGMNPAPTPTPEPTPTPNPTPTPDPTPSPLPAGSYNEYNLTGFSYGNTGGGTIPETDPRYKKVYNATDLADAINKKKGYKVIEIMNDLNLGWNELSAEAKTTAGSLIVAHNAPKTHPVLLQTGVSNVYLDTLNGVTIFSANGSKIKHASFDLKHSTNIIIRNLVFDELWEWDEATKGNYDKNDWDFLTVEDDSKVWIDHCTFNKSYDGGVDIKKGSSGVTISWSMFKGDDRSANSWVTQQINALENNRSAYPMYNYLRSQGLSTDDIIAVSAGQKKQHLVGATEFASDNANLQVTLHHNYYKDMQDRLPRLRGGNAHAYNIVMDSSGNWEAKKLISDSLADAISAKGYHFGVTSNGAISTEGGAVLVEKSQIIDIYYPLRNNQADPNNPAYTGKIFALDIMYSLDGTSFRGNSNEADSPLSPVPAPIIPFAWNGFTTLPYSYATNDPSVLRSRLLATNGAGAGKLNWSKEKWLLTELPNDSAPPAAVTGLSASTSTDNSGQVSLTWNTVDGANYYNVYRSISHDGPYAAIADHITANTFIDLALHGGTTYYYVITASNAYGESAKSVEANVSIHLPNTAPTTVITSYSNGSYLNMNTPILTWAFNDPDAGDIQTAFQIQASSDNWTTISADYGEIADASELYTMGALTDGEWALRVRTKDRHGVWSEWAYRSLIIDTVAPITIDDAPKGWVNKDITVSLLAADMGSGVAVTYYTVDGSTPQSGNTVTITSEGIHTLVYWSVDRASNVEEMKSLSLHLDKTGPSIQLVLDKTTLWPANNKPVTVTATVYSSDNLSQIDSIVLTSITPSIPDDGVAQMIGEVQFGTLDTTFLLLAKKASEKMDLVYVVKYTATDRAGNKADAIASVRVPHDQSGK